MGNVGLFIRSIVQEEWGVFVWPCIRILAVQQKGYFSQAMTMTMFYFRTVESEDIGYHPSYSLFGPTRIQLINVIHLKVIDILKRCAYNMKCNYNPWYQCLKIVPKLRYPAHEMRNQLADKIDKRLDWREPCDRKAFREGFLYVRSPVSGEMDPVCDVAKDIYSRCCLQIRFPKQILRKQKYITQTQKILFACGLPLIQISKLL